MAHRKLNGPSTASTVSLLLVAVGAGIVLWSTRAAAQTATAPVEGSKPPVPVPPAPTQEAQSSALPKGKKVLLIGDSLAVGMKPRFLTLAKNAGYSAAAQAEVGTTIKTWKSRVASVLQKEKPDLVLISLGTNDSVLADPKAEKADAVELLSAISGAGAKAAWVGPPTMPPKNTLNVPMQIDVVANMLQPLVGDYYDSRVLNIPRGGDRIHPASSAAYADWFDAVWKWLAQRALINS